MLFNVPQYIDVEDKIVGPLTAKQLIWMIILGVVILVMWSVLPKPVFFIVILPVVAFFVALAFYKPYGQPLIKFVIAGVMYLFIPKNYIWKRIPQKRKIEKEETKKTIATNQSALNHEERKRIALKNLEGIAKVLDSEGAESDSEIIDILKRPENKK
ncbi:MAG: hypothetical protein ACD_11C00054G0006 [uncultured bacterium]|nr:MAG: hypothetical protein ACD_11C00054G0006 [uncultured bacterium]HBR71988.1 hypothetical protein [Candidatus Moranbacteria bacterium]